MPAPSADFNKKLEAEYLNEFIASKVTRLEGTYSVRLPWLTPVNLASNKDVAWMRFIKLIKQLQVRNLVDKYAEVMDEMCSKFAELVTTTAIQREYYLPHHCVLRLDEQWAPEASDKVKVLGHFLEREI